jgi:serine/threonine protein kinase
MGLLAIAAARSRPWSAPMSATLHPLPPGTVLSDGGGEPEVYRIISHLAEGGMASIYSVAVKGRSDGPFAVKINHAPSRVPLLFREAWWQSQGHRGVVPCYWSDHTRIGDQHIALYVMPYLREGTLVGMIAARTYTRAEAVSWIHGISATLEALRCVHRDLKPENIMLHRRQPLLADFGLAVWADGDERARWGEEIAVSGTLSYMSPEQHLYRRLRELDVRSDIYALTLMLHELWHGSLPFPTTLALEELIARKVAGEVRPRDTGHRGADALLAKGLSARRASRQQSHGEFRHELQALHAQLAAG